MIPNFLRPKPTAPYLLPYLCLCLLSAGSSYAQVKKADPFKGYEHLFTPPNHYQAKLIETKPEIDGNLTDEVWKDIPWSTAFVDIEGEKKPEPALMTRCKMIWDKEFLYIAATLNEPHVWANIKEHDDIVFYDNDFEVFIDPDGDSQNYFEIELNALNTTWDLFLAKPYRNMGHALFNWEAKGMKTAVKVDGTINDAGDIDKGWTVEMAIPYRALQIGDEIKTPEPGDTWRINFSRVEWDTEVVAGKYIKKKDANGKTRPEHNWVWSPQGVINMHLPERWGYLHFGTGSNGVQRVPFDEHLKKYLWLGYYKQVDHLKKNGRYTENLSALGLSSTYQIEGKTISLSMEGGHKQFLLLIKSGNKTFSINQDGILKML